MGRKYETRLNSDLYAKINALPLTAAERAAAIEGLCEGAMVADAILWVVDGIKHLVAGSALKPSQALNTEHPARLQVR